jgi:hypothetical protein
MNGLQALKTGRASITRKITKPNWGGATRPTNKGVNSAHRKKVRYYKRGR